VILDLARFIDSERPLWDEFEKVLERFDADARAPMTIEQITRFHYLYQRSSSDLARIATFSAEPRTREYLESLVARGYAEINARDYTVTRFRLFRGPLGWFFGTVPRTFRKHFREFALGVAITVGGAAFGAAAIHFDSGAKAVLMPFPGLMDTPGKRVKEEESAKGDRLQGHKTTFSAELMTHNIQVSLFTLALGMTWGIGSVVTIFYNGVILGAVAADYVGAGYTQFLLGWLLPHGVIEIPAILVAGQAGFVIAGAMIGWGDHRTRNERLRLVSADILNLAGTAAVMLVWAGIIEAFLSQYHQPVVPYNLKIGFGLVELTLLIFFFTRAGRAPDRK
jgi:uncharacterized membrane protein SpoIIM required for sporulation